MRNLICLVTAIAISGCAISAGAADDVEIDGWIKTLQNVGSKGRGNREATEAWRELAKLESDRLLSVLAGLDGANPLAANYLRGVVDTIAERTMQSGGKLPKKGLEAFVMDQSHAPRGRRLAFDWLTKIDSTARERLIPKMINDPSLELRHDAVAQVIAEAESQLKSGNEAVAVKTFVRALQAARSIDQIKAIARQLRDLEQDVDLPGHFGFLTRWKLVGPFDNTEEKGYAIAYPPEKTIDLTASYDGKLGEMSWIDYTTDDDYGVVDLTKALDKHKGAIAYATTRFTIDKPQNVQIRIGCINAVKLWVNGQERLAREIYHTSMEVDQYVISAKLRKGKNVILMKICQNEQKEVWAQRWQFQLRVCDMTGAAIHASDRPVREKSRSVE